MMKGGCLCKKVTFEISTFSPYLSNCHCSMCRKFHGAAYATYGTVEDQNIEFTVVDDALKVYQSSDIADRGFCQHCGSSIYYRFKNGRGTYDIALGTLDNEPNLDVSAHIYYQSKPEWSGDFSDSLPKYDEEHDLP